MKSIVIVLRISFGLIFFVFGLNGFLHFLPVPEASEAGSVFLGALFKSGYFFPVLKIVEIVSGGLVLSGFFIPLGLILLAPITVQIFLFHIFLDSSGIPLSVVLLVVNLFLAYSYRSSFQGILERKTELG